MPVDLNEKALVSIPQDLARSTPEQFANEIRGLVATSPPAVVLDCGLLRHVTSSHVGQLWQARQICSWAEIPVVLRNASPNLWRILQLLDLAAFFGRDADSAPPVHGSEFPATEDGIGSALQSFGNYLRHLGLPTVFDFELRTLFYEVATNIRFHGKLQKGQAVKFRAEAADNRVVMVFCDPGYEFDPTAVRVDTDFRDAARRRQQRGFGLTMIRRLADTVTYRRIDGGINELTVTKQWST